MNWSIEVFEIVREFGLDLNGIVVLTELATGPFCVTPVIAAIAGAEKVYAVGGNSRYGTFDEAREQVGTLAEQLGISNRIVPLKRSEIGLISGVNIVTNLGHLRPLDKLILSRTTRPSCVALMWEPWELRPGEIDLAYCATHGIPVVATDESHPLIKMDRFLGMLAVKLLLERGVAVVSSRLLVLGNPEFADPIRLFLSEVGADVVAANQHQMPQIRKDVSKFHAIIVADHSEATSFSQAALVDLVELAALGGTTIINISGLTDDMPLTRFATSQIHPRLTKSRRYMAANTGDLGLSPVLRLHSGGLRAAQDVCRALSLGVPPDKAVQEAVQSGFALVVSGKD